MSQTQSCTNEGYGELGKLVAGEAASALQSVVCIANSCTANEAQTYAGIDKFAGDGLQLADANVASSQTTVANDTAELDHVFTASGTANVYGFGVCNDDDNVLYGLCCFASVVAMESSDTLTVEFKMQFKAD